jgi:hypothetical protein
MQLHLLPVFLLKMIVCYEKPCPRLLWEVYCFEKVFRAARQKNSSEDMLKEALSLVSLDLDTW